MVTTTTTAGAGGAGGTIEPAGPTKLTVVGGVVDSAAIRLCFLPFPTGSSSAVPWPDESGLSFAHSATLDLTGGVVPADGDVELVVIGGLVGLTSGMTCDEVIAAPPGGVQAVSIGVLPESVFDEQKSLLLVPNGCIGGPGHSDELEEQICGYGYSEMTPNASLVAGFMSRIVTADKVPMQFAQGSLGTTPLTVRVKPGDATSSSQVAVDVWTAGAVAPFPPFSGLGLNQLSDVAASQLELSGVSGGTESAVGTFAQAFANSSIAADDVADGSGLVFVTVGAPPSLGAGSWWNGFDYTVVEADPQR